MINSLKNEADIVDKYSVRSTEMNQTHGIGKYDRYMDSNRMTKPTSYHPSSTFHSKMSEIESYSIGDNHNNYAFKYTNASAGGAADIQSRDSRYSQHMQLQSYNGTEADKDSLSNKSYELGHDNRFKNTFHSTPLGPSGPVRLPYIIGGGSPIRNEIGASAYQRIGAHHHSISESSNYAIGVGKTVSSSNLKATVSGGKLYVNGAQTDDRRERIELQ